MYRTRIANREGKNQDDFPQVQFTISNLVKTSWSCLLTSCAHKTALSCIYDRNLMSKICPAGPVSFFHGRQRPWSSTETKSYQSKNLTCTLPRCGITPIGYKLIDMWLRPFKIVHLLFFYFILQKLRGNLLLKTLTAPRLPARQVIENQCLQPFTLDDRDLERERNVWLFWHRLKLWKKKRKHVKEPSLLNAKIIAASHFSPRNACNKASKVTHQPHLASPLDCIVDDNPLWPLTCLFQRGAGPLQVAVTGIDIDLYFFLILFSPTGFFEILGKSRKWYTLTFLVNNRRSRTKKSTLLSRHLCDQFFCVLHWPDFFKEVPWLSGP